MIKEIIKWVGVGLIISIIFWETVTIIIQNERINQLTRNVTTLIDENTELKWENSQTTMYCENERM